MLVCGITARADLSDCLVGLTLTTQILLLKSVQVSIDRGSIKQQSPAAAVNKTNAFMKWCDLVLPLE